MTLNEDLLRVQYEDFPPPEGFREAEQLCVVIDAVIPYRVIIKAPAIQEEIAPYVDAAKAAKIAISPMAFLIARTYLCEEILKRDEPGIESFLTETYCITQRQAWRVILASRGWRENEAKL